MLRLCIMFDLITLHAGICCMPARPVQGCRQRLPWRLLCRRWSHCLVPLPAIHEQHYSQVQDRMLAATAPVLSLQHCNRAGMLIHRRLMHHRLPTCTQQLHVQGHKLCLLHTTTKSVELSRTGRCPATLPCVSRQMVAWAVTEQCKRQEGCLSGSCQALTCLQAMLRALMSRMKKQLKL